MDVKEKLLEVTMNLRKEKEENFNLITIREIAKRAEVGVGLINYRFQSKKNLIDVCVQKIVSGVIAESKPDMENRTPMEKWKRSVKIPMDFLMSNPEISRISILGDFAPGESGGQHLSDARKILSLCKRDGCSRRQLFQNDLQGIFLRRELYKDQFDLLGYGLLSLSAFF